MARSLPLLMVDTATNEFYSLAEKQLASLGDGDMPIKRLDDGNVTFIVGSSHGWIAFFNYDTRELYLWNPVFRRFIDLPSVSNLADGTHNDYCAVKKLILSSATPDDFDCRTVILYGSTNRLAFCCPGQSGTGWISIGGWWHFYENRNPIHRNYADLAYSTRQNRLFAITLGAEFENIEVERWDLEDPYAPRIDGKNLLLDLDDDDDSNDDDDDDLDDDDSNDDDDNDLDSNDDDDDDNDLDDDDSNDDDDDNDLDDFDDFDDSYNSIVVAEKGDEDEVLIVVRNVKYSIHDDDDDIKNDPSKDPSKTVCFNVFKVVQGDSEEMTVTPRLKGSLNGLALFVGINESMALSATDFPELMPDSVYFTNIGIPDKTTWWSSSYGLGHYDIGVFDYQNRIFYPCYYPQQCNQEKEGDNDEDDEKEHHEEEDFDEEDEYGYLPQLFREEEDSDEEDEYESLPQLFWFTPTSLAD